MNRYGYIALALLLMVVVAGCSTKKATWPNVTYHNTTTHYNIWWNGNESLKEAEELMQKKIQDDYTQILPIYKIGTKDEVVSFNPQLDRAIEKGVKGIKKHSMYIKGKEYVKYIPNCYLLTVYGAFYKQDYITAANTSRVMSVQYAGHPAADEAAILLGRSLTAQQQYVEAESSLDMLMNEVGRDNFSSKLKLKLYLAIAESTLPQNKFKKTVQFIKLALDEHPSSATAARLYYILGQIYQRLEKRSVATKYYTLCLKKNPEYVMEFNARISLAACADIRHADIDKLDRDLDRMLRDKKNEEYHDQIYYAKGKMFLGIQKYDKAVENFKRSVAVSTNNQAQKAQSSLAAADLLYDRYEDYDQAQLYYDTAMQVIKPNYPSYRTIKTRYDILTELTTHTRTIDRCDSLLRVADMSAEERQAFIQKKIDDKKAADEEAKKQALIAQYASEAKSQQNTLSGDWYFYNSNTVQQGKESFKQRWGMRVLEDFWFLSKKNSLGTSMLMTDFEEEQPDTTSVADNDNSSSEMPASSKADGDPNDPYSVAYYTKNIPSSQAERDSMRDAVSDALLNAGYLYYDGVMNTEKALECYLRLANEYPDYDQIVQAFYMLYKLYDRQGNTPNANYYRDMVLMGFPDSDFANLIRDENYYKEIAHRNELLQQEYDELYTTFRRHRYKEVINQAQVIASECPEDQMIPKFRYWEALSYKFIDSVRDARRVFEEILKSVPATDSIVPLVKWQLGFITQGKELTTSMDGVTGNNDETITVGEEKLAVMIDPLKKENNNAAEIATTAEAVEEEPLSTEAQMYRYRENMQHYVFVLIDDKKIRATDMQYKISDFNSKYYSNAGYRVNPLMFTDSTQLITIHRFKNAQEAMDYWRHIQSDEGPLKSFDAAYFSVYPISTQNYTTFYSRKKIEFYKEFFDRYYRR